MLFLETRAIVKSSHAHAHFRRAPSFVHVLSPCNPWIFRALDRTFRTSYTREVLEAKTPHIDDVSTSVHCAALEETSSVPVVAFGRAAPRKLRQTFRRRGHRRRRTRTRTRRVVWSISRRQMWRHLDESGPRGERLDVRHQNVRGSGVGHVHRHPTRVWFGNVSTYPFPFIRLSSGGWPRSGSRKSFHALGSSLYLI